MILGAVEADGDAIVEISVRGPRGQIEIIDRVVVDTGFNGWLTLSADEIEGLGLELREEGRYWLADGSETVSRLFSAEMEWFGQWRKIMVLEMEGGSLLGMAILNGYHLGIDVINGGAVEVHPL